MAEGATTSTLTRGADGQLNVHPPQTQTPPPPQQQPPPVEPPAPAPPAVPAPAAPPTQQPPSMAAVSLVCTEEDATGVESDWNTGVESGWNTGVESGWNSSSGDEFAALWTSPPSQPAPCSLNALSHVV